MSRKFSGPLVLCDFDGTITLADSTDLMLERFAGPGWRDIEKEWIGGKIGSRACLERQLDLVRANKGDLEKLLEEIPMDASFPPFVSYCATEEIPLAIASDSFDFFVTPLLQKYGLDSTPTYVNRLRIKGERVFPLFPYSNPACGNANCKCSVLASLRGKADRFILVGDGLSDGCVAAHASLVFAKKRIDGSAGQLLESCREKRIPCYSFAEFPEILAVVVEFRRRGMFGSDERWLPRN